MIHLHLVHNVVNNTIFLNKEDVKKSSPVHAWKGLQLALAASLGCEGVSPGLNVAHICIMVPVKLHAIKDNGTF